MKFRVHHITISVKNVAASEKFYEIFGFKRYHYWQAEDKSLEISHLRNTDNITLELFCYANFQAAPEFTKTTKTDLPVIGNKHFALQVTSLFEAKMFLETQGITLETAITNGRTKVDYFFIKDPDGILLEIVQDDR